MTSFLYILLKAFLASSGLFYDNANFGVLSLKMKKKPSKLIIKRIRGNPSIIFIINTESGSPGGPSFIAKNGEAAFPTTKNSSGTAIPTP
jgi:hypothetical protein